MNAIRFGLLALVVWPFTPWATPARAEPPGAGQTAMAEDIEIMRQLLMKRLHVTANPYAQALSQIGTAEGTAVEIAEALALATGDYDGAGAGFRITPKSGEPRTTYYRVGSGGPAAVEGAYLRGVGAVFTVTLPASARSSVREALRQTAAPPPQSSEWERMRQELRGQKPAPQQPAPPAPPTSGQSRLPAVTDAIVKLLAENGAQMSQLGDGESITVAVTFRDGTPHAGGSLLYPYYRKVGESSSSTRGTGSSSSTTGTPKPPQGEPKKSAPSSSDLELLGDLHLKNGRYDEAIETFKKAAAAQTDPAKLSAFYSKLALAYQAKGGDSGPRDAAMLRALEFMRKMQTGDEAQAARALAELALARAGATATKPALPARLVITAKKRDLAAVAGGKMSAEQFRQAVTVDFADFPAEKK